MKTLLTAIVMILGSLAIQAEEFRTWTQAATKRTIEAKLSEKDDKAGTVTLIVKDPKTGRFKKLPPIKVSSLIEQDQKYVKEWVKEIPQVDQLTVRVVGSGRTKGKRVEVDVKAGKVDVVVSGGCDGGCHSLRHAVEAGGRGLYQIEVHDKYTFTLADAKGLEIDQETALRKTGKTDSR